MVRFETKFELPFYFTPKEVLEMVVEKIENFNLWYVLLFPIRFLLFCIIFCFSIALYPLYLINKLLYLLNIAPEIVDIENIFLKLLLGALWYLVVPCFLNFIYYIIYYTTSFLSLFLFAFQSLYNVVPPKTDYCTLRWL